MAFDADAWARSSGVTTPAAPAPPPMAPMESSQAKPFNAQAWAKDYTRPQFNADAWAAGYHAPKKPPNALQLASDYLDVPFYAVGAARRGGGDEFGKVFGHLAPDQIQDVADRYNLMSPEQLQIQAKQGDPFSAFFLKHPKVAGAAQFAAEFANPVNLALGPVTGAIGKGLGFAAKTANAIPAVAKVTKPIGEKLTQAADVFRPYAGLGREGGVKSQAAGRALDQAKADADTQAQAMIDPVWEGLTKEERIEVERRSENFGRPTSRDPYTIKNPPRPVSNAAVPDAELTKRAVMYRRALMNLDRMQLQGGVADPERMYASRTYTPRWSREAYQPLLMDKAQFPQGEASLIEREGMPTGGENRSFQTGTLAAGKHKSYHSYDEAEASGKLHPEYDPATNAKAHFRQRLFNANAQKRLKAFQPLGQLTPLQYGTFGTGEAGYKAMMTAMERQGRSQVSKELRSQMGLPARLTGGSAVPKLAAKLSEARAAKQQAGVMAGTAERGAQAVEQRTHAALWDQVNRQQKMVDSLNARIEKAQEYAKHNAGQASANALGAMVRERDKLAARVENMRAKVEKQAQQGLGIQPREKPGFEHERIGDEMTATSRQLGNEGVRVPNQRGGTGISQIYAPVVGRLQSLANQIEEIKPRSKAAQAVKDQALSQLRSLGERALRAPVKTADAAERHGKALLKAATNAMGTVARATNDPSAQRMLRELETQVATMGRGVGRAHTAGVRQAARISEAAKIVSRRAFAGDARAQKRFDSIVAKLDQAKIDRAEKQAFEKALNQLAPERVKKLQTGYRLRAEQGATKAGFNPIQFVNTTLSSVPVAKHSAVRDELGKFLEAYGAKREEADAISAMIDSMNRMTRIGIISNPVVHVLWNLNNQFLGAGGNVSDVAKIYNWKWHPPEALLNEARENGAIVNQPAQMQGLGGLSYGKLVGSAKDLTLPEKIDKYGTGAFQWANHITFEVMEERFAALLYQHNLKAGMSPAEAGIQTRKALGDYANVSRTGMEAKISHAMFFYPWLKTIIPFWAHALTVRPQVALGPSTFARTSNQLAGDPNTDKERPTAIYLGSDAQGNPRYFSWPGPQKILADLADVVESLPQGPLPAIRATEHVVRSHLRPDISLLYDVVNTASGQPAEPGPPNFDVLFNKNAPPSEQWKQFAENAAERVVPMPLQLKGAFDFARQLPQKSDIGGDVVSGTATGALGGTVYDRPSPLRERATRSLEATYTRYINEARKAGKNDLADFLYWQWKERNDRIMRGG